MARVRVLLGDDHKILADALSALLKPLFDVIGTAANGRALFEEAVRLKPDVIVTDIFMPELNGLDAIRQMKSSGVQASFVVLTMQVDPKMAADAFRSGARGFVAKQCAGEELVEAINHVSRGRAYLTPLVARNVLESLMETRTLDDNAGPTLTARQRQVLQLIAEGKTMKEVADLLAISVRTAETHKYEIMRVLGVETIAELVHWAIRLGIISVV